MRVNGEAIRALRRKSGIGLRTLATDTGVSRSYLSEIENGVKENASERVLEKIADRLVVPVASITRESSGRAS